MDNFIEDFSRYIQKQLNATTDLCHIRHFIEAELRSKLRIKRIKFSKVLSNRKGSPYGTGQRARMANLSNYML